MTMKVVKRQVVDLITLYLSRVQGDWMTEAEVQNLIWAKE
jgi:hypothetical protein